MQALDANYSHVKEALIVSAESLLKDHTSSRTEEEIITGRIQQHNNKRDELERKASLFSDKIKVLRATLDDKLKEINTFQYGIALQMATIKKYEESIKEAKQQTDSFQVEYEQMSDTQQRLGKQYEQLGSDFSLEEKRKVDLTKSIKETVSVCKLLDKEIEKLDESRADSKKKEKIIEMKIESNEKEIERRLGVLQQKVNEKQIQIEKEEGLKVNIQNASQRIEAKGLEITNMKSNLESLRNDKEEAKASFENRMKGAFEEVVNTLETNLKNSNACIDNSRTEINSKKNEELELTKKIELLEANLKQATNKIQMKYKEREDIEKVISELKSNTNENNEYMSSLRKELQEIEYSIQESEKELTSRKGEFSECIKIKQEELSSKLKENDTLKSSIETQEDIIDSLKEEEKKQKENLESKEKLILEKEQAKNEKEQSIESKRKLKQEVVLKIQSTVKETENYISLIEEEKMTLEALNVQAELAETNKNWKLRLEQEKATIAASFTELSERFQQTLQEEYENEIRKYKGNQEFDRNEVSEIKLNIDSQLNQKTIEFERERKKKSKEIDELKQQIESMKKSITTVTTSSKKSPPPLKNKSSTSNAMLEEEEDIFITPSQKERQNSKEKAKLTKKKESVREEPLPKKTKDIQSKKKETKEISAKETKEISSKKALSKDNKDSKKSKTSKETTNQTNSRKKSSEEPTTKKRKTTKETPTKKKATSKSSNLSIFDFTD
ncbi:hypothetical protein ABK040_013006 [Willaertia magna]